MTEIVQAIRRAIEGEAVNLDVDVADPVLERPRLDLLLDLPTSDKRPSTDKQR
jgi:hypothetical protein